MKKNHKVLTMILVTYLAFFVIIIAMILPAVMKYFRYELIQNVEIEVLVVLFFILITFVSVLIPILFSIHNRENKDEIKRKSSNIYLDDERSYLESQINELTRNLVSTNERWKEAYHLILSSQDKQLDKSGHISTENFLRGFGINASEIKIQGDLAFVLTSFHNDFTHTYNLVVDVCKKMKLTAIRGDEKFIEKDILKHIIKCIVKSRVVIANLDGRNPNVFYELGIAHTLNKPTILLANIKTEIPIDINNQYLILYENEDELCNKLTETLLKVLTASE